jgi:hypothetical protein
MDEFNTIIVIDDGTNLLFGLSSTMIDSKEGMEPPPSLIVCIICSMKDKEIVELKDRLHTLREEEKGVKAYIDEMDAKWWDTNNAEWTRRMEKLEISNDQLRISNNELRTSNDELMISNDELRTKMLSRTKRSVV